MMVAVEGEETMQEADAQGEKIFVSVRLRPLNQKEIARDDVSDWECINDTTIIYRNNLSVSERSMYPSAYTFDRVFSSDCSTRQVYEQGAKEVALSVVSGINASIFAYGQTSSGKTYTMSGITEYTIADIYDYVEKHKEREFLLKFSAMEIYNESVRDLLSTDITPLRLLDDPERGTVVEKLTEETLRDWNHFRELLSICEAQRQIGETALNETSSRSHQILRLTIESSTREFVGKDSSSILTATVNFVDLAGSERASQSLSAGARLKEGCHINRSLLTLGTVIRKLSKGRNGHIPFRDSKLTRILQSSLGGNARTSIICTMSPARSHVEQSRNTLLFASCAKEVSTNAQVNIVMSDKALVKHLQRELARLESELRSPGLNTATSDYAVLLREKDFQIEELKKEIMELTLQRDLAQSELEDMRQSHGSERVSIADARDNYPRLRVRSAWEFDNHMSTSPTSADPRSLDTSVRTFDAARYFDGNSHSDSDDQFVPIPYFEESSVQSRPSSQHSISIPDVGRNIDGQEEIGEHYDENSEDFCREVRCIETEEQSLSWHVNADMSPSQESEEASSLMIAENAEPKKQEPGSPIIKESQQLDTVPKVFDIPSPEKSYSVLQEVELSNSGSIKLVRSRSCKAGLMSDQYPLSLENLEKNHVSLLDGYADDFSGKTDGWQRKNSTHEYSPPKTLLSRTASQNSSGSATDVQEMQNTEISGDDKTYNSCITVSNSNIEDTSHRRSSAEQAVNVVDHDPEEESGANIAAPKKDVRDVGLDPMQDECENSPQWPSEFKRFQKEIIELWNVCNVLLVHRTYFFLLFKGDPADSIYMEVELRRLTFLKNTFARGNKTLENGRVLTAASSLRDLRRERLMLSKQIQKRLTRQDKERLYQQWGIDLNSKHRSLQLAHQLWTNTEDMGHITESASVVARLVGLVHPEEASRELFCLNFTPRPSHHKSSIWKNTVMSIL